MGVRVLPSLKLVTAATAEPVLATEAKAHLRETATAASVTSLINGYIVGARDMGEEDTGRAWMKQTWDMKLDEFPCDDGPILVPKPPLQSITSITYVNSTGGSSTLAATGYRVDRHSEPARITPAYGAYWPTTRDVTGAVTVRFVCGYTTASGAAAGNPASVPRRLKQGLLLTVGHWYENRERVVVGEGAQELPVAAKSLYNQLRVFRFE